MANAFFPLGRSDYYYPLQKASEIVKSFNEKNRNNLNEKYFPELKGVKKAYNRRSRGESDPKI